MNLKSALDRYRIMAYLVGVLLISVFVCIPQIWPKSDQHTLRSIEHVLAPIHGYLYLVYLLSVVWVFRRYRLGIVYLLAMVAAGFVPFLSFVVEYQVRHRLAPMRAEAEGRL